MDKERPGKATDAPLQGRGLPETRLSALTASTVDADVAVAGKVAAAVELRKTLSL
jgi:hypothetical protein